MFIQGVANRHWNVIQRQTGRSTITFVVKGILFGLAGLSGAWASSHQKRSFGAEFQVNTYTTSRQERVRVSTWGPDDFFVIWRSNGQDGSGLGVYARTFLKNGTASSPEFRVNTYTSNHQDHPDAAQLIDGSLVATWDSIGEDGSGQAIIARKYWPNGTTAIAPFRVNSYAPSGQQNPRISPLLDGGFVITWQSNGQDGSSYGIFAKTFEPDGAPVTGDIPVNDYTSGAQQVPAIATLSNGLFAVTWQSNGQDGSGLGIYGRLFYPNGTAVTDEFRVNTYTTGDQRLPDIASFSRGGFIITWDSEGEDGDGKGIYTRKYLNNGTAFDPVFRVNTNTIGQQRSPSIASFGEESFVIIWHGEGAEDGDGIFGKKYHSGINSTDFAINTYSTNAQHNARMASFSDGTFLAAWESDGQDGSLQGIFARIYSPPLAPPVVPPIPIPITTPTPLPVAAPAVPPTPIPTPIPAPTLALPPTAEPTMLSPPQAKGGVYAAVGSTIFAICALFGIGLLLRKRKRADTSENLEMKPVNDEYGPLPGNHPPMGDSGYKKAFPGKYGAPPTQPLTDAGYVNPVNK